MSASTRLSKQLTNDWALGKVKSSPVAGYSTLAAMDGPGQAENPFVKQRFLEQAGGSSASSSATAAADLGMVAVPAPSALHPVQQPGGLVLVLPSSREPGRPAVGLRFVRCCNSCVKLCTF